LTIVRILLTDPKTALAGVMVETAFARFMASMAISNEEMVPSRPFGRWGLASIVETQRGGENSVRLGGRTRALMRIGDRPVVISHVQIEESYSMYGVG